VSIFELIELRDTLSFFFVNCVLIDNKDSTVIQLGTFIENVLSRNLNITYLMYALLKVKVDFK